MASIDIRDVTERVDTIIFADDESEHDYFAFKLTGTPDGSGATIHDGFDCNTVKSKTDAENLIKALQKAIELGWVS